MKPADHSQPPPRISVVIPAFRRRDGVLTLLEQVFQQDHPSFEVIVVEDRGDDGTLEAVAERFPSVVLLQNERNGGPAVSRNRGIRAARGSLVVGFDSDVTLPDPTLLRRTEDTFHRHPEATGLAFRLLAPDGVSEDTPRWWHPRPIGSSADAWFETSYFSGTAYAFRRDPLLAAGLFPELLYMHYEEVELAFRIIDRGGALFHAPELRAVHHANPVSRRSEVKVFYKPRNQMLLALRCYPMFRGLAFAVPRMAYAAGASLAGGYFRDWLRAIRSAWRLAPACLAVRQPLGAAAWERMRAMRRDGSSASGVG